jgi:hypothetical protein
VLFSGLIYSRKRRRKAALGRPLFRGCASLDNGVTDISFSVLFWGCLTAENRGVMVFSVGRCRGGVPVEMAGVTGDKHLRSVAVSGDQKKKKGCCETLFQQGVLLSVFFFFEVLDQLVQVIRV